jgi:hypothetical protein
MMPKPHLVELKLASGESNAALFLLSCQYILKNSISYRNPLVSVSMDKIWECTHVCVPPGSG